jgi:hypothetical protein
MVMKKRSLAQVFLAPIVISCVVAFGLISALLGDEIWDAASWVALGLPLAIVAISLLRKAA